VLADVDRVLGGQLADMTFCDPPYNVEYANSPKDKLRGKHRPILNDDLGGGFEAFLYYGCVNILSVTKGARYIRMSSSELHTLQRAFATAGVPGLFRQYNAPADFVEAANTIGLPRYAKQAVDQQVARWVMLHVQSNPLPICTRPRVLIKGKRT
jgi:hypothetical protein